MARLDVSLFVLLPLILLTKTKDPFVKGIWVIKNRTSNESTNKLLPSIKLNATVIKDNSINKAPGTNNKTVLYTTITTLINSSTIIKNATNKRENISDSHKDLLKESSISTTRATKIHNITTGVMPSHPKPHHSHKYKILEYILIPLGCILFIIAVICVIRHIQRVKKKRRLERELLYQYSYPNSEEGDIDEEERFLEVESVVNTQFNISSDQEEKNFVDEVPQVSVAVGEGSKLVLQDSQSLLDLEASTSFNC